MSESTEQPREIFKQIQDTHEGIMSELEGLDIPEGFSERLLSHLSTLATIAGLEGVFVAHGKYDNKEEIIIDPDVTTGLEGWGSAAGYFTGDVGLLVARGHSEGEIVEIRESLGLEKGE